MIQVEITSEYVENERIWRFVRDPEGDFLVDDDFWDAVDEKYFENEDSIYDYIEDTKYNIMVI